MTHLWKGISVLLGVLTLLLLFFWFVEQQKHNRPAVAPDSMEVQPETGQNTYPDEQESDSSSAVRKDQSSSSPKKDTSTTGDGAEPSAFSRTRPFIIFNGMTSRQKPEADITAAGVVPVDVVYSTRMFDGRNADALKRRKSTALPDRQIVEQLAHRAAQVNNERGIIDIEHWILNPEKGFSAEEVQANMQRLLTVLSWYKEAEPDMSWGYYGEVPIRNYWAAVRPRSSERYLNWQRANNAIRQLALSVDALYPSLYTFYRDREGWVRYAEEHIAEARRLNPDAPVYVFLWPEYHMSNSDLGLQPIETDFWKLQLETAYQHADGIVIYTRGSYSFSESTPWWKATKEFMKEKGIG